MILRTTSPVPVADLLKALASGGAAAPAAPAAAPAAGGGGAPPSGAEGRKIGGKYVKRWWENGRWNYDYGEGGAAHHSAGFGHHEDPKREHHHALPDDHQPHPGGAERDYHFAHARAFAPGAVHQVPHPARQGEHIAVAALPGGKIEVREASGRSRPFNNHAEYERWHLGAQAGAKTIHDAQGVPFAQIMPRIGEIKDGKLQPREDTGTPAMKKKAWVVRYNPAHPHAPQGIDKNSEFASTREGAEKKVAKRFSHIARFAGGQQSQVPDAKPEGHRGAAAGENDALESQLKWRLSNKPHRRGKPELDVTPEEREGIIRQVAHLYTPFLMKQAAAIVDSFSSKIGALADPKIRVNAINSLLGVEPGTSREGTVIPMPGSHLHRMIGNALDNYDPTTVGNDGKRQSLKGYLTAGSGHLVNALRNDFQQSVIPQVISSGGSANAAQPGSESLQDRTASEASTPEEQLAAKQESGSYTDEGTTTDPAVWQQRQAAHVAQLAQNHPELPRDLLEQVSDAVRRTRTPEHIEQMIGTLNSLDRKFPLKGRRWSDYIADFGKSMRHAVAIIGEEMAKALGGFVMRDKGVDPTHVYSHREGTDDHPRYYFRDAKGNYIRYTNAPSSHGDASKYGGDAAVHFAEPSAQKAPQFFSPDGRKLTRAPLPGVEVQWNRNYHPQDPENLWFGRWVNPQTGEHEHTYLDADVRSIPELFVHQQNCLTDVRIPILRAYVKRLSSSPHLKDRVTALGLALVDQGRMRLEEIGKLKVGDVSEGDGVWKVGNRFIYGDRRTRALFTLLTRDRHPEEPFLAVPMVKADGDLDADKIRRVGPHYLEGLLEQLGLSGAALQVYHATQCFSREVQRVLYEGCVPWEIASAYAAAYVAAEMGYDLRQMTPLEQTLPIILEMLVDPVVVEVLERNARAAKLCSGDPRLLQMPRRQVALVSLDLSARTADEQDFSSWLHSYPVHTHARVAMQQMQTPDAPSVRM